MKKVKTSPLNKHIVKLNKLANKYLPKEVKGGHKFIGVNRLGQDPNIISSDDTIFRLNPIMAGTSLPIKTEKNDPRAAVYRLVIGYSNVTYFTQKNKEHEFMLYMYAEIAIALNKLTTSLGDLSDREIYFTFPGSGNFFRDVVDCAGVEFRIFVKNEI